MRVKSIIPAFEGKNYWLPCTLSMSDKLLFCLGMKVLTRLQGATLLKFGLGRRLGAKNILIHTAYHRMIVTS